MRLIVLIIIIVWTVAALGQTEAAAVPELVAPGVISTGDFESHIEFTPDGDTAYFVRSLANFAFWTIYETHRQGGQWSRPEIAQFSGHFNDADPFITSDGRFLFFMSNRPLKATDQQPKQDSD